MLGICGRRTSWALMAAQWRRATLTARHGMLASAHSGIDLALWDLKAQSAGAPLWQSVEQDRGR